MARSEGSLTDVCWKPCDVTDSASVLRVFEEILKERGRIDVLVCNAGIGISGAAEFAPEHDYQMQTDVNFNGAVRCAQAAVPAMRRAGRGKIVFISSLAAVFPLPFQGFYSATKAALNAFSDSLGIELKPFGIETSAMTTTARSCRASALPPRRGRSTMSCSARSASAFRVFATVEQKHRRYFNISSENPPFFAAFCIV